MDAQIADLLLHINETLDYSQREALEAAFREMDGVISVRFQTGNPHLALVAYNPDRVTSQELHEMVICRPFGRYAALLPDKELHAQVAGL